MAIANKFLHFKTKAGFLNKLAEYVTYDETNNIYTAKSGKTDDWNMFKNFTCFIKETHEIWTHEQFYICNDIAPRVRESAPFVPNIDETVNVRLLEGNNTVHVEVPVDFTDGHHWPISINVLGTIKALAEHTQTDIDFPQDAQVSWTERLNCIGTAANDDSVALYGGSAVNAIVNSNGILGTIDLATDILLTYHDSGMGLEVAALDVHIEIITPKTTSNKIATLSFSNVEYSDQYVFNQSDDEILEAIDGYVAGTNDLRIVFEPTEFYYQAEKTSLPFVAGMISQGGGGNDAPKFVLTAWYRGSSRYFDDCWLYMNLEITNYNDPDRRVLNKEAGINNYFNPSSSAWPNWYKKHQYWINQLGYSAVDGFFSSGDTTSTYYQIGNNFIKTFERNSDNSFTVTRCNIPEVATENPIADGIAAVGTSTKYAREDHIHPAQENISGNAGSSNKWATPRTITLNGAVSGNASLDGSTDISLNTTLNNIDASKITSGTISIDRLPAGALERLVIVENQSSALSANIQEGDVVQITEDNNKMYFCISNTATTFDNKFKEFTAGTATRVPWSGVTDKPTKFIPTAHNQPSNTITSLTDYTKGTDNSALTPNDSLNIALGKLENQISTIQNYTVNGMKISTNPVIEEATYDKSGLLSSSDKLLLDSLSYNMLYYGIEWRPDVSDPVCTRIGNMNYHKTLPIQSAMKGCIYNPKEKRVVYWLDDSDWKYKKGGNPNKGETEDLARLDGYDGEVMVYIPEFWIRSWDEEDRRAVCVSPIKIDDTWEHQPSIYLGAYKDTVLNTVPENMGYLSTLEVNTAISVANSAEYCRGGNNNATNDADEDIFKRQLGKCRTALSRSVFRTYVRKAGKEIMSYRQYKNIIYWLYIIEYANFNSQASYNAELTVEGYHQGGLGNGITNVSNWDVYNGYYPINPNGYTNEFGNGTGTKLITPLGPNPIGNVYSIRWRGLENPFGDTWNNIDGIIIDADADNHPNNMNYVYTTDDPTKYGDTLSDIDNMTLSGLEIHSDGYIKEWNLGYTSEIIPRLVGGSSSLYKCDNHWCGNKSNILRTLLLGGDAHYGGLAGLGGFHSNDVVGRAYANVGFRSACFC